MFKYFTKLSVILALFSVPLFGFWSSGESSGGKLWYYARSAITPAQIPLDEGNTSENIITEFILDARVVVACSEDKDLNVYMQFSDILKLDQTIQLVDRYLYDIEMEFGKKYKKSFGALHKKNSMVLEFLEDQILTQDLRGEFELLITMPWRDNKTVTYLVSLEGAAISINETIDKCGIEFDKDSY